MDDPRERLIRALVASLSAEECDALLGQAREEALGDVRQIVREALREPFLEAVAERVSDAAGVTLRAPTDARSRAPAEAAGADEPAASAVPLPAGTAVEPSAAVPTAVAGATGQAAVADAAGPAAAAVAAESAAPAADGAASEGAADAPAAANEAPLPGAAADESGEDEDDEARTRREIAEIKKRLAENERFLAGAQPPDDLDEKLAEANAAETAERESESGDGFYLYGVVRRESEAGAGLPGQGVDPDHAAYLLPDGELTAVVSRVPLESYGEEALQDNLKDLDWVEERVRTHHEVLLGVLAVDPGLVPMRFCTIYRSEDRVLEVLDEHQDELMAAIDLLRGRREWGVKMYCEREAARRWAKAHGETVTALEEKIAASSAGAAYMLGKKLDEVLDTEVEDATDAAAQAAHDTLSHVAAEATLLPLRDADDPDAGVMIMNAAYLVDESATPGFEAALERLGDEHAALGCSFEMTGPWPAYNFVSAGVEEGADE